MEEKTLQVLSLLKEGVSAVTGAKQQVPGRVSQAVMQAKAYEPIRIYRDGQIITLDPSIIEESYDDMLSAIDVSAVPIDPIFALQGAILKQLANQDYYLDMTQLADAILKLSEAEPQTVNPYVWNAATPANQVRSTEPNAAIGYAVGIRMLNDSVQAPTVNFRTTYRALAYTSQSYNMTTGVTTPTPVFATSFDDWTIQTDIKGTYFFVPVFRNLVNKTFSGGAHTASVSPDKKAVVTPLVPAPILTTTNAPGGVTLQADGSIIGTQVAVDGAYSGIVDFSWFSVEVPSNTQVTIYPVTFDAVYSGYYRDLARFTALTPKAFEVASVRILAELFNIPFDAALI